MNRTLLLLFISFLFATESRAQDNSRFGLKAGYNSSIFSASVNTESSYKSGLNVGAYVDFKTGDKFHIQPEVNYSSQGELENYTNGPGGASFGKTTVTLTYINIPLVFKADLGKVVNFQFGPQFGLLLSGREKGTISGQAVDNDLTSSFKSDFSMLIGLGFNLSEHVNLGARFNYGLTNIYNTPAGSPISYPSVSNRVFNIFMGYTF